MNANVESALARIPLMQGVAKEQIQCERLGGLTNLVYKLTWDDVACVLRIPGKGTNQYIDRRAEAHNARIAAEAGVSAEILFADEQSGLMLSRYLSGCATMTAESFCSVAGAPTRAALALKYIHDCGQTFLFQFELFKMIDEYLSVLARLGAKLPDGYHEVVRESVQVRSALDASPMQLAPCHCDPLCENFLDNRERMWVVDWEYSGMNDPIWDLGDLSVEAGFTESHDREMMEAYCGGAVPPAIYGRMVIYKAMCDLLWTLWGLIQHAHDNPADDFWAYALNRFERCTTLMGSEEFGTHLAAVASP